MKQLRQHRESEYTLRDFTRMFDVEAPFCDAVKDGAFAKPLLPGRPRPLAHCWSFRGAV